MPMIETKPQPTAPGRLPREARHDNRNERWYRDLMRMGHNRKPGAAARQRCRSSRRSRRGWNRRVRLWVRLDLLRWGVAA